jgi:DNA-directed RNA polymerase subunit omega
MENLPPSESRYRTVHLAARRARQLQMGAPPLVPTRSTKVCRVAQEEVLAGKVEYRSPEAPAQKDTILPAGYTPILHG